MARGAIAMGRNQPRHVEIGEIVGMRHQEGLVLKPVPIGKHGAAGPEQLVFVD